jgi:tRNA G18 (ribose-2'-O)-methylase SpoU
VPPVPAVETERIDDPDDPRLADYRSLTDPQLRKAYEARQGVFIVESPLAVELLAASPHAAATCSLLVGERRVERMAPVIASLAAQGVPTYTASADVLRATAGFDLHRGVVAAVRRPDPPDADQVLSSAPTVLALEGLNDHENLGVAFRTAAAFGVDAVALDPTCADPWYRRCVRVSMGHVLQVPHVRPEPWPGWLVDAARSGRRVVALTPRAEVLLHEVEPAAPGERLVVVAGAEGPGLTDAVLGAPGVEAVRIAMAPGVDSLNVASSIAVALHHLVAHRLR